MEEKRIKDLSNRIETAKRWLLLLNAKRERRDTIEVSFSLDDLTLMTDALKGLK